ncbi:hypothetical protein ABH920_006483 [Catenulispora sp. EB89]|uniref:hypothetical protein n=1 Tax=Catenulispora sp. EB89 TaxID=3156257 RepID=UPI0035162B2B
MKLASHDLNLNRGLLFIGSGSAPENELVASFSGKPAVASLRQLLVRVRAQNGMTRVALWLENGPQRADSVFRGQLDLGGELRFFDFDGMFMMTHRVGSPGLTDVVVGVDGAGAVSRIDVVLAPGSQTHALTTVGPGLLPVFADGPLSPPSELAMLLSDHDATALRLASAIKVLVVNQMPDYTDRLVVEWLRWLRPGLQPSDIGHLEALIASRSTVMTAADVDDKAAELARELLSSLNV